MHYPDLTPPAHQLNRHFEDERVRILRVLFQLPDLQSTAPYVVPVWDEYGGIVAHA